MSWRLKAAAITANCVRRHTTCVPMRDGVKCINVSLSGIRCLYSLSTSWNVFTQQRWLRGTTHSTCHVPLPQQLQQQQQQEWQQNRPILPIPAAPYVISQIRSPAVSSRPKNGSYEHIAYDRSCPHITFIIINCYSLIPHVYNTKPS